MDSSILSDPDSPLSRSSTSSPRDKQRRSPSSQRSSSFLTPNRSPCTSPTLRSFDSPFSRQNRRLQLRNAGFRGGLLPAHRPISPQFAVQKSLAGLRERDEDKENCSVENGRLVIGSDEIEADVSQRKSTRVLREIQISNQRRKPQPARPFVSTLFQELDKDDTIAADASHLRFDNSRPKTPLLEPFSPEATMRPNNLSPFTDRLPSTGFDRQKRPTSTRIVSRGTSRYIEHLETQLAASLSRTDSGDSPTANNHASKYKALSTEHKLLKQELSEWEDRFEDRLKEEMAVMIDRESQLRSKLRLLEREVETKDNKIKELQWEAEMDHQRLRSLEAVNSTNRSLEKRVDVLTGLLAQSPAKSEQGCRTNIGSEFISPDDDPIRRTPRPRSMFSRIPLSPIRRPLFQPLMMPESDPQDTDGGPDAPSEIPDLDINYIETATYRRPMSELGSLDSGLGDSCSMASTRLYNSQRSSTISQLSSPSLWGTAFPLPLDLPRRHRRMRRFPSGSCTLKPFILPATSSLLSPSTPSYPADNNDYATHSRTYSANEWHSPSNFVQFHEDTLNALEGNNNQYQSFEEAISGHELSDPAEVPYGGGPFDEEYEDGCFPNGHLHPSGFFETPTRHSRPDPEPSKRLSYHGVTNDSYSPAAMTVVVHGGSYRKNKRDLVPGGIQSSETSPLESRQFSSAKSQAGPSPENTFGDSHWFRDIMRGSIVLAKRILFNSWHSNWKKIGKLPWWVLGLILGQQRRNEWFRRSLGEQAAWSPQYHWSTESTGPGNLGHAGPNGTVRNYARTRLSIQELRKRSKSSSSDSRDCEQPANISSTSLPHSFRLWAKFSLAIALAIGLAVKDGPASIMHRCAIEETPDRNDFLPAIGPELDTGRGAGCTHVYCETE
ncbi:predicted protein [Uncinocarpus reesii 1704]|uniref:Uncharacterized protein n=1 Tax=Uncinocarpus reesii (strain UAMH 1704) TaxID=336963 RepID=C4JJJ8_UNCRE|nr:uncharacterized protein UREG_01805 [Uncinocarpus reesii 1704]EEP76956.1 predicted protein [Uncinocarpus reesii 1704]